MGFLVSIVAVVQIMVACLVFTQCSKGLFQDFVKLYCLHLHSDDLVQDDAKVTGNKSAVHSGPDLSELSCNCPT